MRSTEQIVADMYEGDPDKIVPGCFITVNGEQVVLHPYIAILRNKAIAQRERERIAYCDQHDIDPTRFNGCHRCELTGIDQYNKLTCFCDMGRVETLKQKAAEIRETARLYEVSKRPPVVEVAA